MPTNMPARSWWTSGAVTLASIATSALGQGGDSWFDATPIDALPFCGNGTTEGYTDLSDETCPYSGSTSPDVWYTYSAPEDGELIVSLCGSSYDTKLYVYDKNLDLVQREDGTSACNDDNCWSTACGDFRSALADVPVRGGDRYYIVIDGYGGSDGNYDLWVRTDDADDWECQDCGGSDVGDCDATYLQPPETALPERDPCGTFSALDANDGCDGAGHFAVIACGADVDGRIARLAGIDDADWFIVDTTGDLWPSRMRVSVVAEFPGLLHYAADVGTDCASFTGFDATFELSACAFEHVVTDPLPPGRHLFVVTATPELEPSCGTAGDQYGSPEYWLRVRCISLEPPPPLERAPIRLDNGLLPRSVSIHGDVAVVGDYDSTATGAVAVHERQPDGTWPLIDDVTIPDGQENVGFGARVAVHGDVLAVAATLANGRGTVYLYGRETDGHWTHRQSIPSPDPSAQLFGLGLHLGESELIIGAPGFDGPTYIFARDATGGTWKLAETIMPPEDVPGVIDRFGTAIVRSGDHLAISAPSFGVVGAVFVFRRDAPDDPDADVRWRPVARLDNPGGDANVDFGYSLAFQDEVLLVAAQRYDGVTGRRSMAYAYRPRDGAWVPNGRPMPMGEAPEPGLPELSYDVTSWRDMVLVSEPYDADGVGTLHAFVRGSGAWRQTRRFAGPLGVTATHLAHSDGERLIGAGPSRAFIFEEPPPAPATWMDVLNAWATAGGPADVDGDGVVGIEDLVEVLRR